MVTNVVGIVLAAAVLAGAWTLAHRYDLRVAQGAEASFRVAWRLDRLTGHVCRVSFLGEMDQPTTYTHCTP
jgi:hypothetical protein